MQYGNLVRLFAAHGRPYPLSTFLNVMTHRNGLVDFWTNVMQSRMQFGLVIAGVIAYNSDLFEKIGLIFHIIIIMNHNEISY